MRTILYSFLLFFFLSGNALARGSSDPPPFFGLFLFFVFISILLKGIAKIFGESVAGTVATGMMYSFFFAVIPLTIISICILIFNPSNPRIILGWTCVLWFIGCIIYMLKQNFPEIKKEKSQTTLHRNHKKPYGSRSEYAASLRKMGVSEDQIQAATKKY